MAEPFTGIGKPEALKYMEGNFWSRRIDLEHRLIYVVDHEQIIFYACRYHYEQ
jgi:toxin YoeB